MEAKIVDKVKRLLSLANSGNENEAAAAAAAAASLMEQHHIAEAMLNDEEVQFQRSEYAVERGNLAHWKMRLAMALGSYTGVCPYRAVGSKGRSELRLVGSKGDLSAFSYLYSYCVRAVDAFTKRRGKSRGRSWCNDYRHGCIDSIKASLQEARERETEATRAKYAEAGTSLVAVNSAIEKAQARAADAHDWLTRELGVTRKSTVRSGNIGTARERGKKDGKKISVSSIPKKLGQGTPFLRK